MEVVKIEFLNASNNAESKLVEDVSALDNSVQVLNPNIFPAPPFLISIGNEILRVNEVQNGVFMNVDRGVEGTTPASHSAGSSVENRYTAGMYHSVADGVNKVAGDLELHKGKMATDDTAGHIRLSDIPTPPVTSVNSKTGAVSLNATDVGAETPAGAQAKVNTVRQDLETHEGKKATQSEYGHIRLRDIPTPEGIPRGIITMWSGSIDTIPEGWALCDGNNGTPDLRDRFVMGASDNDVGETGGENEVTLTIDQIPPHRHNASTTYSGSHTHSYTGTEGGTEHEILKYALFDRTDSVWYWRVNTGIIQPAGNHTHKVTIDEVGKGQAHENRPAYYKLAFIMKL